MERRDGGSTSQPVRAHLGGPLPQEALEVYEVSLRGIEVRLAYALASGQPVPVTIAHPILPEPLTLAGQTAWCRVEPGHSEPRARLEFVQTTPEQRKLVRQIQAARSSHRVHDGSRMAGFLVAPQEGAWAVYDEHTIKVALILQRAGGFEARLLGHRPEASIHTLDVDSVAEAVAMVLSLESIPQIVAVGAGPWIPISPTPFAPPAPAPASAAPPPPPPPGVAAQPPLAAVGEPPPDPLADPGATQLVSSSSSDLLARGAFHRVLTDGSLVGYVAVTSVDDAWSIYDFDWREVAILVPEKGRFKVTAMGHGPDDSLEYFVARSFLGAIGQAFHLSGEPQLDPPMAELPQFHRDPGEPAPAPPSESAVHEAVESAAGAVQRFERDVLAPELAQHAVFDAGGQRLGSLTPAPGVPGVYNVFDAAGDKLAIVAPEDGRFKILYMGEGANDSLEYLVARSFQGALSIVFEQTSPPLLEPPIHK